MNLYKFTVNDEFDCRYEEMPMSPSFELVPCDISDQDFLFALHRDTMGEYVSLTFGGWDEELQRKMFLEKFSPESLKLILHGGLKVGVLQVAEFPDSIFIANIQVLPKHQGSGLGAAIITSIIERARLCKKDVTLQVFKVNPARRLYERLGFRMVGESPTHFQMRLPITHASK